MTKLTPEYIQRRIAFSDACEARLNRGAPCEVCAGRGCPSCVGSGQSTISAPRPTAGQLSDRMLFQMMSREWFRGNVVRLFMPPDFYESVPRGVASLHDRMFGTRRTPAEELEALERDQREHVLKYVSNDVNGYVLMPPDHDPATVRLADIKPGSKLRLHDA